MSRTRRLLLLLPFVALATGAFMACGDSGSGGEDPEAGLPPLDPNAPAPLPPFQPCRRRNQICASSSQCCDALVCASAGASLTTCQ